MKPSRYDDATFVVNTIVVGLTVVVVTVAVLLCNIVFDALRCTP